MPYSVPTHPLTSTQWAFPVVGRMNRCGVYLLSYKAKQIIQLPVQANNISAEQKDHSCPFVLLSDMKDLDTRGCVKIGTSSFFTQSPDFLKPGLCYEDVPILTHPLTSILWSASLGGWTLDGLG